MKIALLSLLSVFTFLPGAAQFALVHDGNGDVVNGDMVVHWGDNETANQTVHLDVVLTGTESKVVNVRRYELAVDENTQNYFCWGICYGAVDAGALPTWQAQSQHSLVLEPSVPVNNFSAYHSPQGVLGTSTYRYVWFDVNSPNDSVWVDIRFQVTSVGVEERTSVTGINVFPNPATLGEVTITYQGTGNMNNATIAFRNMVGQVVLTEQLTMAAGKVRVSVSELPAGVYFATIEQQENILATQRLVISH